MFVADGSTEFKPEAGRYHLYGQHLCPFSNRATIGRVIKGLDKAIGFTNCDWVLPEGTGWKISPEVSLFTYTLTLIQTIWLIWVGVCSGLTLTMLEKPERSESVMAGRF